MSLPVLARIMLAALIQVLWSGLFFKICLFLFYFGEGRGWWKLGMNFVKNIQEIKRMNEKGKTHPSLAKKCDLVPLIPERRNSWVGLFSHRPCSPQILQDFWTNIQWSWNPEGQKGSKEWLSLSPCVSWAAFAFRNQYHMKNKQSINEDLLGSREGCN